jgi:hypothetical protein
VGVAVWVGGSSGVGEVTDGTYRTHGTYMEVQQQLLLRVEATLRLSLLTNHFSPLTVRTSRDSSRLRKAYVAAGSSLQS